MAAINDPHAAPAPVGTLLRDWRLRRRLSQMEFALDAGISTRHLSFLETGRSQPSREMVLRLAQRLDVPLRERNGLLIAAGFAPMFTERPLDDPAMARARDIIDRVLTGHEPFPALAVDRHWHLLSANRAVGPLLAGVDAELLAPPVNVLRLSLHPRGLAPRIANLAQWRSHLLERLERQGSVSGDPLLLALHAELAAYPHPGDTPPSTSRGLHAPEVGGLEGHPGVAIPFQMATPAGVLSFLSTTTVFGTPVDVTLSEIAIEAFFPADAATATFLRQTADLQLARQ